MRIDFLITNPLLVDHFSPVVLELARRGHRAKLALFEPNPDYPLLAESFDEEQRILAACRVAVERGNAPWGPPDLDARVVVTALSVDHVRKWKRHRFKFRYGVGLLRTGFHYREDRVAGFDGFLLHGEFERHVFSAWADPARMRTMGMPRHDAALRDLPDRARARQALGIADEKRRVLGYFPTWGEHAGIGRFAAALEELAGELRVVVKAHALTGVRDSEEPNQRRLGALDALQVAPAHPLAEVLLACDVVVADAKSGVGPESALLAPDVPLVLTSNLPAEAYFDELASLGVLVTEPDGLAAAVRAALDHDPVAGRRRDLAAHLFADREGSGAARAADAILELARVPTLRPTGRLRKIQRRIGRLFAGRRGE